MLQKFADFLAAGFLRGVDQLMLTILEGGFKVEFELIKFKLRIQSQKFQEFQDFHIRKVP